MNSTFERTLKPFLLFLGICIFFQAMGGLMGWITASGIDGWYQGLSKSPLNPPDYVFGIVWTGLYFLLSVAFWLVWKKPKSETKKSILILFASHMVLNWCWSPLFFTAHQVMAAFLLIVVLFLTAALLCWKLWRFDRVASIIFIPYMAWLCFAGHLSLYIWQNN